MISFRIFTFLLILSVILQSCKVLYTNGSDEKGLGTDIAYLASDDLQGRYPGSQGDVKAGDYIEGVFRNLDLRTERQLFTFFSGFEPGDSNSFNLNNVPVDGNLYGPMPFSADSFVDAPVLFCDYGLNIKTDSFERDDYKGRDVKGKWVMILQGHPDIPGFSDILSMASDDRDKALLAYDLGAAGILFVSDFSQGKKQIFDKPAGRHGRIAIPAFQISPRLADSILALQSIPRLRARADIDEIAGHTSNRYGILSGTHPTLKNEYIIVGAHYDHLGTGGIGSSSRTPDISAVHNGADDNASGIGLMLDLARKLKGENLSRSIIFVAFGAEEMGLLGSKYFIRNWAVDSGKPILMINLDMVGRLDTAKGLRIGGTGTFIEADSLIRKANKYELKTILSPEGSGPSDHSSFYAAGIPVLFVTTGAHTDYHTPEDDAVRINYKGIASISNFLFDLVIATDGLSKAPSFQEAGPAESAATAYKFKVTLGFMPDFSTTDIVGVRVEFVSKGKAAERGGVISGDIITAMDGHEISNIYDYMYRLGKLAKNQIISLEILRDGKKEILLIQL